jgi:hypothetical protein
MQHVDFEALETEKKAWQLTAMLRALGIRNPRNIDFKDASRVLTEFGIEPRKTNGKKVYDVSLIDLSIGIGRRVSWRSNDDSADIFLGDRHAV